LDEIDDKLFRRTELGDAEIRERAEALSRYEQTVLVSIDGEAHRSELAKLFSSLEMQEFEMAIDGLLRKNLIVAGFVPTPEFHADLSKASIEEFDTDGFFSSSMSPMHQGSGLVVDTRANRMKSVNLKKRDFSVHESFELSLGLDDVAKEKKSKHLSKKLIQVFPEPAKKKKRKRSKRQELVPEPKWKLRLYMGIIAFGILVALVSMFI
jgi:hypothetical protein